MPETIKVLHVVGRMDRGGTETLIMNLLRTVDRSRFQYDIVEQTRDCCDYDAEICARSGFQSESHAKRAFRERFGKPMSSFR